MLTEDMLYHLLDAQGIPYELHRHAAVFTVEAAEALGLPPGALPLKNLFLRDDRHRGHWLVCMPADKRLDLRRLQDLLGSRRLSFASERDLEESLGVRGGSVTPLALLNDETCSIPLVIDREIREARVQVHPLVNTATIYLSAGDVVQLVTDHGNPVVWLEL